MAWTDALVEFVEEMTRLNKGRAYYTGLDNLGGYVFADFVKNRRRVQMVRQANIDGVDLAGHLLQHHFPVAELLPPTADEERLTAVSDRLQHTITTLGGKIDKVTPPARRRLAYELAHHRDGHYGVLEFSLPPDQAREFERTIRLTEEILRHIVVRRDE